MCKHPRGLKRRRLLRGRRIQFSVVKRQLNVFGGLLPLRPDEKKNTAGSCTRLRGVCVAPFTAPMSLSPKYAETMPGRNDIMREGRRASIRVYVNSIFDVAYTALLLDLYQSIAERKDTCTSSYNGVGGLLISFPDPSLLTVFCSEMPTQRQSVMQ